MRLDDDNSIKLLNLHCKEDRKMLRGAWIRDKKLGDEVMIVAISRSQVYAGSRWITSYELYRDYEWLDGSPIRRPTDAS